MHLNTLKIVYSLTSGNRHIHGIFQEDKYFKEKNRSKQIKKQKSRVRPPVITEIFGKVQPIMTLGKDKNVFLAHLTKAQNIYESLNFLCIHNILKVSVSLILLISI